MRNLFRWNQAAGPRPFSEIVEEVKAAFPEQVWRRPDHWRVVFCPQGHLFARFELLPTGDWQYSQPGNALHEPIAHTNIETLMAQAELDWAAHWQVLRQADEHIALYNKAAGPYQAEKTCQA